MITKKRIRSMKYFTDVKEGDEFYLGLKLTDDIRECTRNCGFSENFEVGESLLPPKRGSNTRRNADGDTVLQRDLPKEDYSYTIEWTRKQWVGGGDTEEVTDYVTVTRKRYQREQTIPFNKYLTIVEMGDDKYIIADKMIMNEDKSIEIIHTANVILEIFAKCEVFDAGLNTFISEEVKRLDWDILPPGEAVWEKAHEYVERVVKPPKNKDKITHERIDFLKNNDMRLIAIGNAGFNGYMVYQHEGKNLFFLENPRYANATYVFDKNWEEFSRLTKSEIINNNLQVERVVHTLEWKATIKDIIR